MSSIHWDLAGAPWS